MHLSLKACGDLCIFVSDCSSDLNMFEMYFFYYHGGLCRMDCKLLPILIFSVLPSVIIVIWGCVQLEQYFFFYHSGGKWPYVFVGILYLF